MPSTSRNCIIVWYSGKKPSNKCYYNIGNIILLTKKCIWFDCIYFFQIVNNLDPTEYGEFLNGRKLVVEQQLLELKEKKEAKMLRG